MKKLIFLLITIILLMGCVSFRNDIVKPKIDENDPIVKKLKEMGIPYKKEIKIEENVVYYLPDNPTIYFYFVPADLLEIRYYEAQKLYEFDVVYEDLLGISGIVEANFYLYSLTPEQEKYIRDQRYTLKVCIVLNITDKSNEVNTYFFDSDKALGKPIRTFPYFDPHNPVE